MTVEFGDAVSAFAASLVEARRTLDTATAQLGQVYAADEHLKSLPTPAFTLAEAEFEVPYVVEEVVTEPAPPPPELPRRAVVKLGESDLRSLQRGVDDRAQQGLQILTEQYARAAELYARARQDPAVLATEPIPTLDRPKPEEIELLKTGASKLARERFDRMRREFEDIRGALLETRETLGESSKPRVMVRLDAEALAGAAPEHVQRARFTFRDAGRATVDVDGEPIAVTQ